MKKRRFSWQTELQDNEGWYLDLTFRWLDDYGFLPIVKMNEQELFRGEYTMSFDSAVESAMRFLNRRENS
tara:strand:+ start:112 stop:321 length:210 start_codon:yes stop_codon:yes gene_type:complete